MKNVDNIYFDVCEFTHSDSTREITISIDESTLNISGIQIGDSGFWIIKSNGLATILKENYKSAYPMFFGVLIAALHEHNAKMPICEICLGDVDRSLENTKVHFYQLAELIATGKYLPGGAAGRH